MPRATRSRKIVIAEDETAIASQIALPDTPRATRSALAEINNVPEAEEEVMTVEDAELFTQLKGLKAAYKTAIGVKKNKRGKNKRKGKEQPEHVEAGSGEVVLEDRQRAVVSPAADGARKMLSSDEDDIPSAEKQNTTPPSPAVEEARQQLNGPKIDQTENQSAESNAFVSKPDCSPRVPLLGQGNNEGKSSTEDKTGILCQIGAANHQKETEQEDDRALFTSPIKAGTTTLEEIEKAGDQDGSAIPCVEIVEEDSFVEQIISRSPAKPFTRIEDSVEALDQIEEAIEALSEAAITVPPTKIVITSKKDKRTISNPAIVSPTDKMLAANRKRGARAKEIMKGNVKPFASLRIKSTKTANSMKAPEGPSVNDKEILKKVKSSSALRDSVQLIEERVTGVKKPVKRPASLLPPKKPARSTKAPTISTYELPGEAVARKLKEQREARKAEREASEEASTAAAANLAPKVKSAKPPTKPTFELPGEALSRKKREAHEARLKAQEEEEKSRREFKARPVRKSVLPDFVPRETVASRARKSQIGMPENETRQTFSSLSVGKRGSVVGSHRPSILAANLANISAPRSPGPVGSAQTRARKVSTTSGPSMSGLAVQRAVSASEAKDQRQRAKAIYNRDMNALEDLEKEKKEREAAAKRSRLEAAERGRQASREWAEKMKAKKAAEGDKGMSVGFGPGGQMGLKAL